MWLLLQSSCNKRLVAPPSAKPDGATPKWHNTSHSEAQDLLLHILLPFLWITAGASHYARALVAHPTTQWASHTKPKAQAKARGLRDRVEMRLGCVSLHGHRVPQECGRPWREWYPAGDRQNEGTPVGEGGHPRKPERPPSHCRCFTKGNLRACWCTAAGSTLSFGQLLH